MNQSVHQLLQVILQGISWVLRTIDTLPVWLWSQIAHAFDMLWWNLPPWKLVVGLLFVAVLVGILFQLLRHCLAAFAEKATAFWTITLTVFGIVMFVVIAGVFSLGFQSVVTTMPDRFWEKLL